jgi:hypothetical protein
LEEFEKDLDRIGKDHKQHNRNDEEAEKLTMKIFVHKLVEYGVFEGINYTFRTYWKDNKGKLLFLTFCGLPFALFQLF